jgi:BirA family biotin operon repressor/biotin-[acetyl-CoA-carboxylase] ligase
MLGPIEIHMQRVTSTNDVAKEMLHTYPFVFVTAHEQTAGRGRRGRMWHGVAHANVYCSLGVTHDEERRSEDLASFMARGALASLRALREVAPKHRFRLKYPNDVQVFHDGHWCKISGVLVEHEYHGSRCTNTIVGIGVNVEQREFPDVDQPRASLRSVGESVYVSDVLPKLRDALTIYSARTWQDVHHEWMHELDMVGRLVRLTSGPELYEVVRLLDDGRLVVRTCDHPHTERIISDGDSVRYDDRDQ